MTEVSILLRVQDKDLGFGFKCLQKAMMFICDSITAERPFSNFLFEECLSAVIPSALLHHSCTVFTEFTEWVRWELLASELLRSLLCMGSEKLT